tara:strand:+ start:290 stop:511 length:222 start_codon:yes stop_codon:yes gene_type:complete
MNKILIDALENELSGFLQKNPHLIDLQFEISKNLAKLDKPEDRLYYMSTELLDSFYSLKEELGNLDIMLKELR